MQKNKIKYYSFIKPDPEFKNNLMAFGFECGAGWYPIIFNAFYKIEKHLKKFKNRKLRKDFQVLQVKEKFGGLRIYTNYEDDTIGGILDAATETASKTCECCGSTENVDMRLISGWYSTLCEKCTTEHSDNVTERYKIWENGAKKVFGE